jgi:hypothetical protein|tara:strand:- start:80325 stop:80573 length:249 start_codon:yes stop_codon:yes gene_type:complete
MDDYFEMRKVFYKKYFIDFICGLFLFLLVMNGTMFTLELVVDNNISIVHAIWIWLTQPLILISIICMFGFNFMNFRKRGNRV